MTEKHNTKIEDLDSKNETYSSANGIDKLELDELRDIIFNFDYDEGERLDAFMKWHNEPNDIVFELSNKLCCMFLISGTKMIREFLIAIINTNNVRDIIKIEFAKTLCTKNPSEDNFDILNNTIELLENSPIVILLECIIQLMKSPFEKHKAPSLNYFITIINNTDYDVHFRYKTILSLEHLLDSKELLVYFSIKSLLEFIIGDNSNTYKILAGQALLQKYKITADERDNIQNILSNIMSDVDLDPNVRADAADVLLNLGDSEWKHHAEQMIMELGAIEGTVRSVYQDAQNVHNHELEKSALSILEVLDVIENDLTFEKVTTIINDLASKALTSNLCDLSLTKEDVGFICIAVNRINVDRQLYSKYNISLKGILLRIMTYIRKSEHRAELERRLLEELLEMYNKCSSGFALRMVNILSGYTEHTLKISWADQIAGNLSGRLNSRIRDIVDPDYQNDVLTEMRLNSDKTISSRKNFLKFFRENIPFIREEMWEEFTNDITDTDFDLYFRRAIAKYEGHEWS